MNDLIPKNFTYDCLMNIERDVANVTVIGSLVSAKKDFLDICLANLGCFCGQEPFVILKPLFELKNPYLLMIIS